MAATEGLKLFMNEQILPQIEILNNSIDEKQRKKARIHANKRWRLHISLRNQEARLDRQITALTGARRRLMKQLECVQLELNGDSVIRYSNVCVGFYLWLADRKILASSPRFNELSNQYSDTL
jgi:hypothetical protein